MLTGFYLLAMLLVPYSFASILCIVFPFPTVSFELARFYICFKSCLYLCVLRLSNARVCVVLFPRSPLKIARLCLSRIVMRTSPHKHRVCAVIVPRFPLEFCPRVFLCFACFASQTPGLCSAFPSAPFKFVRFCLSRFVMRTLPHKHRVCAVLFFRFPFKKFLRLCFSRFVMRVFPHKHRVYAAPFPRPPVKFVRLSLSCYLMRTSPHKHQFRAVLFSRLPFKFTRLD